MILVQEQPTEAQRLGPCCSPSGDPLRSGPGDPGVHLPPVGLPFAGILALKQRVSGALSTQTLGCI